VSTTARPPRGVVVRTLLSDAIVYAGLFPPAQLDMAGAVAEYAAYLRSGDAWALGRFVLPAARFDELARAVARLAEDAATTSSASWRLSVVLGADIPGEVARVKAFNAAHATPAGAWSANVEAVELKAATPQAIDDAMRVVPDDLERYIEIPIAGDPLPFVRAIAGARAFAKVRTGGTTPDAFPRSEDLARFLAACVSEGVPFKATAGLHHPLRGSFPLTYQADAPSGIMYGYLNVAIAAMLAWGGGSKEEVQQGLLESDPGAIRFDRDAIQWRHERFPTELVARVRREFFHGFGSCSFREPLDELAPLVQAV